MARASSITSANKDLKSQIRMAAEQDLEFFIRLVTPKRVLGHVHSRLIDWWNRDDAKSHQLVLLPRDHQKSAMVAYRAAWEITRNPSVRILYISATANLAIKQLKLIKDILTSDIYTLYWPDMVLPDEGKREKWTETEISIDHPKRRQDMVRDPTVFTAGLTTVIVGMHCDIAIMDDVVIDANAYTVEVRQKLKEQTSYLASIAGTESRVWVVGTRYHPQDLYNDMQGMIVELFNEEGEIEDSYNLYEVFEEQVENRGDGTGEFLWPRMKTDDGKSYGFDRKILAEKRAQYDDLTKFRAQYYNNPNDASTATITKDNFQYYQRARLEQHNGYWHYAGKRLNVFASIDFAFSLAKKADFSCITVVGVDHDNNYFVLDIDRFKTDKISEYYDHILKLYVKWGFRKLRAETTIAQKVIVSDLRDNYIRKYNLALVIEDYRPMGKSGGKEERIEAILQPRYNNRQMWHYMGGNCELLEEELVMQRPPHDDIKDALASCIEICIPPSKSVHTTASGINSGASRASTRGVEIFHPRFGGIKH